MSTGINRERSIAWLRCGPRMPHSAHFHPLPPAGAVVYGEVPLDSDTVFYPELRFKGLPVTPLWWRPDSEEPILRVHTMPEHKYFVLSPYYSGPKATGEENWQRLHDDGWEPAGKGEWERWAHVDELEKTEGPPPEGQF